MSLPKKPLALMGRVYTRVFPKVKRELIFWEQQAKNIPNIELRTQSLASLKHKRFHCEGGSILALLANEQDSLVIRFIVAYQTISDYLDNLCDRSTSLDPIDFEYLHRAMQEAVDLERPISSTYYDKRLDKEDGNYLYSLVHTCRSVLSKNPNYEVIRPYLIHLCNIYCDLQIHKHVDKSQREERLIRWFNEYKDELPPMQWYEFSACAGSTLGIFAIVSQSFNQGDSVKITKQLMVGYFPYIQGLHILLDYFIDQEEDELEGDLNFVRYYEDTNQLFKRLTHFVQEAFKQTENLPNSSFHRLIISGLLGLYLSDNKVRTNKQLKLLAKEMIKQGGWSSKFFYFNSVVYRKFFH